MNFRTSRVMKVTVSSLLMMLTGSGVAVADIRYLNPTLVTSDTVQYFSLSSDGTKIIYNHASEVWSMRIEGSQKSRITTDGDYAALSADGSTIVFRRGPGGNQSVWLMNSDGTNQRSIWPIPINGAAYSFRWKPDGSKIIFACLIPSLSSVEGICQINQDGSNLILLDSGDGSHDPSITPNGSRIYYGKGGMTWSMKADGSDKRSESIGAFPSFSSDGKIVAYGSYGITIMPPGGLGYALGIPGAAGYFQLTPDGKKVLYQKSDSSLWITELQYFVAVTVYTRIAGSGVSSSIPGPNGEIYIDGQLKGTGSIYERDLTLGTHTLSFGPLSGYQTPPNQLIEVTTDNISTAGGTLVGYYTPVTSPSPSSTSTPASTPTSTSIPTPTPTPTPNSIPTSSPTPAATPTPPPSLFPSPTGTPGVTPTLTQMPTPPDWSEYCRKTYSGSVYDPTQNKCVYPTETPKDEAQGGKEKKVTIEVPENLTKELEKRGINLTGPLPSPGFEGYLAVVALIFCVPLLWRRNGK